MKTKFSPNDGVWMAFAGLLVLATLAALFLMIPIIKKMIKILGHYVEESSFASAVKRRLLEDEDFEESPSYSISAKEFRKKLKEENFDYRSPIPKDAVVKIGNSLSVGISPKTLINIACITAFDSLEREHEALNPPGAAKTPAAGSQESLSFPTVEVHRARAGVSRPAGIALLSAPEEDFWYPETGSKSTFPMDPGFEREHMEDCTWGPPTPKLKKFVSNPYGTV
ncbi:hypothetical protein L596_019034 [Steinernema carpocapsae]|uniref:Uncharacterized protein n=1 Tax=Steinernema carpocapsae TaxID=34508 RepID=A0A4U5N6W9_STECR|nr:hypothetical protein L596_019034 [Steinernema carpocapsae]